MSFVTLSFDFLKVFVLTERVKFFFLILFYSLFLLLSYVWEKTQSVFEGPPFLLSSIFYSCRLSVPCFLSCSVFSLRATLFNANKCNTVKGWKEAVWYGRITDVKLQITVWINCVGFILICTWFHSRLLQTIYHEFHVYSLQLARFVFGSVFYFFFSFDSFSITSSCLFLFI